MCGSDHVSDTDLNVYHLQEPGLEDALALTGPDMNCPYSMRPETNSNDFGFFFGLISRFEFDFRRRGFFERFEFFLVCSNFNYMQ